MGNDFERNLNNNQKNEKPYTKQLMQFQVLLKFKKY